MSRWSAPGRATTATASRAGSGAERLLLRVGAASAAQRRRIPARARCEAVAVLRLQRLQALQHGVDASLADVLDRAAAERGEAGAEDHARIEQVGIFDHAVVQRGDGLVEQRQHQPVLEVPGHLVVLRHLGLLRLALRSEEHTSELQSLMRISYAVFCLKKKTKNNTSITQRMTTAQLPHRTHHNHVI